MTIKNVEINGTCIDVILLANPHGTPYEIATGTVCSFDHNDREDERKTYCLKVAL
jgi:hypothetical protein